MAKAAAQLNRTSSVTYFRLPDGMFKKDFLGGKKMTPTGKIAYALLSSLSHGKKPAFLTYKNYREILGCTDKTTRKFIAGLTESGAIEQDKSNRMYSKYTVKKRAKGKGYTTYDSAYFDIIDKHAKKPVHWTNSVKILACFFIRHIISNDGANGKFVGKKKQIANMLGISEGSVYKATKELRKCKIIFYPKGYHGMYEGKPSEYIFGTALTLALKKHEEQRKEEAKKKAQAKQATKKRTSATPAPQWQQEISAADARAERERVYAMRAQRAKSRAEKNCALANKDAAFKAAEKALKEGEIALARAEVYSPKKCPEISVKLATARRERAEALERLNLTELDLMPRWTCEKCSDTGYLPNGKMCDCYRCNPRGAP